MESLPAQTVYLRCPYLWNPAISCDPCFSTDDVEEIPPVGGHPLLFKVDSIPGLELCFCFSLQAMGPPLCQTFSQFWTVPSPQLDSQKEYENYCRQLCSIPQQFASWKSIHRSPSKANNLPEHGRYMNQISYILDKSGVEVGNLFSFLNQLVRAVRLLNEWKCQIVVEELHTK